MSVSCSPYFPCVVRAHPLVRELRLRIPIQTRAQRGQPSGALRTAPDPEWCGSAICCWTRVLRPEEGGGFFLGRQRSGFLRSPRGHAPNAASHAAGRKLGVRQAGAGLGGRDQRLWIPTVCVPGVVLADDDHRWMGHGP